jgi:predicted membrane protein
MNYLIHAIPLHLSLCLQSLILLFTIAIITVFTLLLLLLFYYYHHYKTVATDKPLRASLFLGAAELTTHLLRLINILWLSCVESINLGFTSLEDCCDPLYLWVISG